MANVAKGWAIGDTVWVHYIGSVANQFTPVSRVVTQANINSSALTSFLELPVNGIDAVIDRNIKEKFDSKTEKLPSSMEEAISRYLGED